MYHFCYCLPRNNHWGIRPLGKWRIFPSFPGWLKPRQWPRAGPELSWVACQRVWGKLFSEGPGNWGFKEAQLKNLRHWLHPKPGSVQVWSSIEGLSDLTQRIDFGSIQKFALPSPKLDLALSNLSFILAWQKKWPHLASIGLTWNRDKGLTDTCDSFTQQFAKSRRLEGTEIGSAKLLASRQAAAEKIGLFIKAIRRQEPRLIPFSDSQSTKWGGSSQHYFSAVHWPTDLRSQERKVYFI